MKLKRIISGGQTGADKTGLECAKELGLQTGGTAPKGWKIDGGSDPSLKDYGLVESPSPDYAIRTRQNAKDADVTIWFGRTDSPGYWCTRGACNNLKKPLFLNPNALQLEYICNTYETANIAGNRARLNPGVVQLVKDAFAIIAKVASGN